jgi:hypothetical protein
MPTEVRYQLDQAWDQRREIDQWIQEDWPLRTITRFYVPIRGLEEEELDEIDKKNIGQWLSGKSYDIPGISTPFSARVHYHLATLDKTTMIMVVDEYTDRRRQ